VGWDAAALEGNDVDALGLRLRHWLRMYEERGVAALLETIARDERLQSRLLAQVDGERRLTDLRHVGEALHAASMTGQLSLTAGLEWLRHRVEEAEQDSSVERGRRLDSEAAAVQVVTVHASKGLEFPVVLVPFGWDRHVFDPDIPLFHEATGLRVRNVGGRNSPGFQQDQDRHKNEEFGEDLRLLYVALTRAQAQVIAWWAPSTRNTICAPLHRLLFTDSPATGVPQRRPVPNDSTALARASALAVDGCLSVTAVASGGDASWQQPPTAPRAMSAATLGRQLDTSWRRTSYTALTAAVHDLGPAVTSEPELEQKDDEPVTAVPAAAPGEHQDVMSPMDALPAGTAFGTLVHAVLERVDPTSADLADAVSEQVAAQLSWSGRPELDQEELTTALLPALRTPLGDPVGGRSLADIAPGDRLTELDFELPLRGGDHPNGTSRLVELAELLREHLQPDDPLTGYASLLSDPPLSEVVFKGYLAGSIDAVLRMDGRYVLVDYKTNRLGVPDAPLTAWDYRVTAMAEAMIQAHYPLQALLYEVALHRFLRWRLADYDPGRHLGGVLYLFLRGMCGPDIRFADGTIPGVFAWQPPANLVTAASDLLAAGRR
jgi:exodeoxyribonuclease V beta subunit